jgi:hypothetical protein
MQQQQQQWMPPGQVNDEVRAAERRQYRALCCEVPACSMQVYQQGMRLMQSRLRSAAGLAMYQQQQQQQLGQASIAQQQLGTLGNLPLQHRRGPVLYHRQEADEAFPDINTKWDEVIGGPAPWEQGHDILMQQQQPAGSRLQVPENVLLGRAAHMASEAGWLMRTPQEQRAAAALQRQAQFQDPTRDEFGVSVQPSLSTDDEGDTVGQLHVGQRARHGQLAHGFMYPSIENAMAATSADDVTSSGQMEAFLSSRKRDFAVPRLVKPGIAGRQLPLSQQQTTQRGAGVKATQPALG